MATEGRLQLNVVLKNIKTYLTYLLTPWSRVLLEKLTGFTANQEIPRILWTPKFHPVLTSARHFCLQRKHLAYEYFVTFCFSRGGVVSASPNPQAGGPPLVGCQRLLIQFIRSYPQYRRPFLHPQPEDAPCRRDSDPQGLYLYSPSRPSWPVIGRTFTFTYKTYHIIIFNSTFLETFIDVF